MSIDRPIGRRTVALAAAWTAPAVIVAAAAPGAAASTTAFTAAVSSTASSGPNTSDPGISGALRRSLTSQYGTRVARLSFTVESLSGEVPAGTGFLLATGGLVDLDRLAASTSAFAVTALSATSAAVSLLGPVPTGASAVLDLLPATVLTETPLTASLSLQTPGPGGSAAPSTAAVSVTAIRPDTSNQLRQPVQWVYGATTA